jgi:hypothetical protein
MKEIIEIVFESVQLDKVIEFMMKILSSSTLKDYQISTNTSDIEIDLQSQEILFNSIDQLSDGSFYFNFLNFKYSGVLLSEVGIQIYKYNNNYDLNIHVDEREVSQKISVLNLMSWAEVLAVQLKAQDYYCGYEPASDKETRFFSGSTLGLLKDWGNI